MWNTTVVGEEGEARVGALHAWAEGGLGGDCCVCVERKRERGRRKRIRPFFLDGVGEREPVAGTKVLGWRINESSISLGLVWHPLSVGKADRGEGIDVEGGTGSGTTV